MKKIIICAVLGCLLCTVSGIEPAAAENLRVRMIDACGDRFAAIDKYNNLWLWGDNSEGFIVSDGDDFIEEPVLALSGIKSVSLGKNHMAVIAADGRVGTYGDNTYGQLGDGTRNDARLSPNWIMNGGVSVACGDNHTLVLDTSGTVYAFGDNKDNAVMTGGDLYYKEPQEVMKNAVAVYADTLQSFVVTSGGELWAIGYNGNGQLGIGGFLNPYRYTRVMSNVRSVSVARDYTLAVTHDGEVYGFGLNMYGQLGATVDNTDRPVLISEAGTVSEAFAGEYSSYFVTTDGEAISLGSETSGFVNNAEADERVFENNGIRYIAEGSYPIILAKDGIVKRYNPNAAELDFPADIENSAYMDYCLALNGEYAVNINAGSTTLDDVMVIKAYYKRGVLVEVETEVCDIAGRKEIKGDFYENSDEFKLFVWEKGTITPVLDNGAAAEADNVNLWISYSADMVRIEGESHEARAPITVVVREAGSDFLDGEYGVVQMYQGTSGNDKRFDISLPGIENPNRCIVEINAGSGVFRHYGE